MSSKILIFSAPSGSGKTTIVRRLLTHDEYNLSFSISACSRAKRANEVDGHDYYFLSVDDFKTKIANDEFLEWQEVYENNFYGSLKSEVERLGLAGKNIVFDVDVKGGLNIKRYYGSRALAIFIQPPSLEELRKRLLRRSTDNAAAIKTRLDKARYEMTFANRFDFVVVNDVLETAIAEIEARINAFLCI